MFGWFGDGGAKSAEVEATMTPPGEMALTLEVMMMLVGVGETNCSSSGGMSAYYVSMMGMVGVVV